MSGPALLLCVGARGSVSGPGALCRGPALLASGPASGPGAPLARLSLSGPGSLCVGPRRFLSRSLSGARRSSSGAACVAARRSLCQGPALLASGPAAPCVGARRSSPKTLFSRYRRSVRQVWRFLSVCRGPTICASGHGGPLPALFLSGPGGPGADTDRRSLCRAPALFLSDSVISVWSPDCLCSGARRSSALSVSGPGALRRSLCVGTGAGCSLSRVGVRAWRSSPKTPLPRPGSLRVGPRRFLSGSVSGPGGPLPALFVSGPGALCRGPAVLSQRSFCRGLALCVGARRLMSYPALLLCVGAKRGDRRSLCWARRSSCRGPALFLSDSSALCQGVFGARIVSVSQLGAFVLSASGPGALWRSLCVVPCGPAAPIRMPRIPPCQPSGLRSTHPRAIRYCGLKLRSSYPSSTARVPPIWPRKP